MRKLKKGSKEAKEYMAKLRRMKGKTKKSSISHYVVKGQVFVDYMDALDFCYINNIPTDEIKKTKTYPKKLSGLERINRRKTTTYVHYTRTAPKKKVAKKTTARKSSAKRVEKRTTIALSNLNFGDTFTTGTSSKIYERMNKVPNQNKYIVVDLAGKEYKYSGTKRVYLEDEYGVSGFVHKKTHGRKTTLKYTHPVSKKVSGVSTPSKSHTDYNSPEVNIQIGMVHDNMSMISKHMHSIAMLNEKIAQIKMAKKFQDSMMKRASDKQIVYLKKNIASYKKQISELKKHI